MLEAASTTHIARGSPAAREGNHAMSLTVTDNAIAQLQEVIGQQEAVPEALRIVISAGGCGCSGPRFGMGFDHRQDGDTVFEFGPIQIVADAETAPQLDGASIDWVDDVMQRGFSIEAPNAVASGGGCGC